MTVSHKVEQEAHSPIGASSCKRWMACPGSVKLSEGIEDEGNIHAATGTVAHTMAERWFKSGNPTDTLIRDEVGRTYVEDDFEIEVTDDMIDAVQVYVDAVWADLEKYNLPFSAFKTEGRVTLHHLDPQAFGTCDGSIVVPMNRLITYDYKHGFGIVEVENNEQTMYYSLGKYYELSESDRSDIIFVELVIVQPNARHLSGSVRRHVISVSDLLEFEKSLAAGIKRVRDGDTTLVAGDHCKWCPAKPLCPARKASLTNTTGIDFSAVAEKPLGLPKIENYTPEQLSVMMDNAAVLRDWCQSIIDYGFKQAMSGQEIPGYKLVEKKANRRWVNESDVEKAFEMEFGDELYTKRLKSPAQMEKLLKTKRKAEIEPYVETPVAGKTLVPIGDGRKAVGTAGSDFAAFEV